jgi:hypothetical protein
MKNKDKEIIIWFLIYLKISNFHYFTKN